MTAQLAPAAIADKHVSSAGNLLGPVAALPFCWCAAGFPELQVSLERRPCFAGDTVPLPFFDLSRGLVPPSPSPLVGYFVGTSIREGYDNCKFFGASTSFVQLPVGSPFFPTDMRSYGPPQFGHLRNPLLSLERY